MVRKILKKYRSVSVVAFGMIFNIVSSLMVYKPDGVIFNSSPLTLTEWICDCISALVILLGILMGAYDTSDYNKKNILEAFNKIRNNHNVNEDE